MPIQRLHFLLPLLLAACVSPAPQTPLSFERELARDEDYAVVRAQEGESFDTLAARYLGDAGQAWRLAELNPPGPKPGQAVVVPLKAPHPTGVSDAGYQTVPILCYHRFGSPRSKLVVSPADFEAQMDYLARKGYHVLRLQELQGFLEARTPLPRNSVILSIDDGYRSTYQIAYPILKKHRFPATLFLYTDFVGAGDALSWAQIREMSQSGLISVQPHSKTHTALVPRAAQESEAQYRERLRREIEIPIATLRGRLSEAITSYAPPYGATSETVSALLVAQNIRMVPTVTPGGNAFFAYPLMLRRSMVFGDEGLAEFIAKLNTYRPLETP